MTTSLPDFRREVQEELHRILRYWMQYGIEKNGDGFYGFVNDQNIPDTSAPKPIVITSRVLWTFAAAHQLFPDKEYPLIAKRAYDYITKYFVDKDYGGVYWSVSSKGDPLQNKKQMYGHSFAMYGLSEYARIANDESVLRTAVAVFRQITEHSYDRVNGGYIEAFEKDWSDTEDYILSKAPNCKSMNTHLHLLESFTNLYRVWKDEAAAFHLRHCIRVMLDHIIDPESRRMTLFFTKTWEPRSAVISFGHDIEASWLLCEAAEVLGDEQLLSNCKTVAIEMAKAAADGLAEDGAIYYEREPASGKLNTDKQWWPQAEAMVGFYNAYELTGKVHYLEKSERVWEFIKKNLVDPEYGEWYGGTDADNRVLSRDKITFWKGPYHNARSCMELWRRLGKEK